MLMIKAVLQETCPTIRVEFDFIKHGPNQFHYTLVAHVIGEYRDGSSGNPDAAYVSGMIRTAIEVWSPAKVIIDFSEMKYEWGDMLEHIYGAPEDRPTAFVVGPKCRKAMSTLSFGLNSPKDILENEGFFLSLDAANDYLAKKRS